MHQLTEVPADAWEQFFLLCLEWAEVVRQRREAKRQAQLEEPGQAVTESEAKR